MVEVTGTASLADRHYIKTKLEEIKTGQPNWHSVVLDIHMHQGSSAFFSLKLSDFIALGFTCRLH